MQGVAFSVFPKGHLPDHQIIPGAVAGVYFLLIDSVLLEAGKKGNKYIMHTNIQRAANQRCARANGARPGNMEMSRVMCKPDEQMYERVCACLCVSFGGSCVSLHINSK